MEEKTTPQSHNDIPTMLVVFGATGDLMAKKIVPSLFHLFIKGKLPRLFSVIGFSRQELSNEAFRASIFRTLETHKDFSANTCEAFCELFFYERGVFEKKSGFTALSKKLKTIDVKWGVCGNKLFYLAVPPQFYEPIFKHLAGSGLTKPCSNEEGWSRILVEKPFGKDLKTAQRLETLLSRLFKEVQIYRIDHYLAKEMTQNILAFRFSNNLFENSWNGSAIEKIEIRLKENIGVEDRGAFYDGLGALRDVGQNHLLQLVALLAMEHPGAFSSENIRKKRGEMLTTLLVPSAEEITRHTFRAQYDGYRNIENVAPRSTTETYFKIVARLSHPDWKKVPFILESGKKLGERKKEAVITFRHPTPCLCGSADTHLKNTITISLEPEEKITLAFWSKKPGLSFELQERDFSFLMRDAKEKTPYTEEYEKLLYDAIVGDQTLFVTSEEVEAMWKYTDPIITAWQKNTVPLATYHAGVDKPSIESARLFEEHTSTEYLMRKEIGIVGLGKMGGNIARALMKKGWVAHGFNKDMETTKQLEKEGLSGAYSIKELVEKLHSPRVIWLMVPAGIPAEETLFGKNALTAFMQKGDIVIDGGNSFYKDSIRRFRLLQKRGIHFVDVGVSGGPEGALHGASLMVGGEQKTLTKLEPLFADIAERGGYQFFEGAGAGHFIKMVHNGIEYGMMQAIAEGFSILKKSKYKLDLTRIADVYNHGSVIESRLILWLAEAFSLHGENLAGVSGSVEHTGEGAWTVETGKALRVKTKIIEEAVRFRMQSAKHPSYAGKILSALREQFGGHSIQNNAPLRKRKTKKNYYHKQKNT